MVCLLYTSRILYTMHERGNDPSHPYRKSADTVGAVLGLSLIHILIPADSRTRVTIDTKEFIETIERASLIITELSLIHI